MSTTKNTHSDLIEYWATEIIDIAATPTFNPDNYVGRRAYFQTYDGDLIAGTLERGTRHGHSDLIIRISEHGWCGVGSYLYLAD